LVFVNLLAAVLLVVLAEPIVRLLFERGQFTAASTHRAATALACLAPGLASFSTVNVLARAFYALGDTKVPMKISVVCLGLNLFCALWLIGPFKQAGLGLANTLSSVANVWLLALALRRKLSRLEWEPLGPALLALLGATVAAGAAAWLGSWLWQTQLGHATLLRKCGQVFVPMAAATLLYWCIACWLRVPQAREIGRLLLRQFRGKPPGSGLD
jgi:putative peptidoglycan lipid II flippase